MRRVLRAAAVVLLVAAAGLAGASTAQAHDALVGTNPADGSTVDVPPHHVTLTFTEPAVAIGTEVVVTGPDGTVASTGPAELVDKDVHQYLLEELPKGLYTVQWRVTSQDGHAVDGTFTFTAANAIGLPRDATAVPVETAAPTAEPTPEAATPTPSATPVAAPSPDDQAVSPGVLSGIGAALVVIGAVVAWLLLRRPAAAGAAPGATPGPPAGPGGAGATGPGRDARPDDLP
ncbi:copper resistance CopC family protein [Cellulomonas sp.]|uniref:copper resistance CopC family protein n=1 Tax=Cellulomonas sp. TaxID=40001 RepID=UPI001B0E0F72|nr:copper resistance CopC family protein [Cellulomonas sp.]MBO9554537.1 copper resistance protein CopC [Cellulomonas sp.]